MEDSHTVHLYLPPAPTGSTPKSPAKDIPEQPVGSTVTNDDPEADGPALFGVFDGHGGSSVAKFSGTTLHSRLAALDSYKAGDYKTALKEAFLKTDEALRADPNFFNDPSGCTAVVGVLADGKFTVANSGDSRCVLGYKGDAKAMSYDHKPTNKEETARITSAGGFVEFGRVNGNLALSRALGDFEFKQNFSLTPEKQIVTADPEFITHELDGEEEFIVLACDGIWDCLSSQQVVDLTRRAIANGDDLGKICEDMMVKCLAKESETGGIGCDNMTVVVVALLGGRTPEEWQVWVKERVEKKVGRDTPASIPDVFAHLQNTTPGLGGLTGSGFRVAGAGGLANIASILGASGIKFRPADDSDDEEESEEAGQDKEAGTDQGGPSKLDSGSGQKIHQIDDDGDSHMDSDEDSDDTTAGTPSGTTSQPNISIDTAVAPNNKASPIPPSFTSIGSPSVPTHQELMQMKMPAKGTAPEQLKPTPQGDEYPTVAKVEGLMDKSESAL